MEDPRSVGSVLRPGQGKRLSVPLLFQSSPPPDHERYFEELVDLLAAPPEGWPEAIEALRARHDIHQLTPGRTC